MSFEQNVPNVIKRRKHRDKQASSTKQANSFDLNIPNYNLMNGGNLNSYPDSPYYPMLNCHAPAEPMSLPVYSYGYSNVPVMGYNGSANSSKPYFPQTHVQTDDSNEYMSLPVGFDQNENSTGRRRFSDPGVPNESDSSSSSYDGRIIQKLTQQVHSLKESNRKLSREVLEMKMELNVLKQQSSKYDREYEPGMLADIIREIRDAARVREDALLAKVKHMIEEKQFNLNQFQLATEKNRNNDRLTKLEEQLKNLTVNNGRSEDSTSAASSMTAAADGGNSAARQVIELEREALTLRRELQDARAKREESDQKLMQLDRKLSGLFRFKEQASEHSEDGKTSTSVDSFSVANSSGLLPQGVVLSGPVTDL